MNTDHIAPEDLVAQHWPLHGPYDEDRTRTAGGTLAELTRYLNYATGQGAATALPYASTVNGLVGNLAAVAGGLDQMLRQIQQRCDQLADDPKLYDDGDYTNASAVKRALSARATLDNASRFAGGLMNALTMACSDLVHLGHRED